MCSLWPWERNSLITIILFTNRKIQYNTIVVVFKNINQVSFLINGEGKDTSKGYSLILDCEGLVPSTKTTYGHSYNTVFKILWLTLIKHRVLKFIGLQIIFHFEFSTGVSSYILHILNTILSSLIWYRVRISLIFHCHGLYQIKNVHSSGSSVLNAVLCEPIVYFASAVTLYTFFN